MENTEHSEESFLETSFLEKDFTNHTFEDCSFERCDFNSALLTGARFVDCRFKSCDLSNIVLINATLRSISFVECKLIGIQWFKAADLVNPSFQESNLNYCGFGGLKLKKITFLKCSLHEVDYSQADLSECDFKE